MILEGRRYEKDERDLQFPFELVPLTLINKSKYWNTGPVLNQGNKPHCVAFAWKQFLQASPHRQGKHLKEDFIYELAQQRDQWPGEDYNGTSVRAGAKVMSRLGFINNYLWARSAEKIKDWVCHTSPVVMGTLWFQDMFNPDDKGFVTPTGGQAGGHAYLCIGYSHKRKAFRFINSWGKGWGQSGRFWMKEEDVQFLIENNGEACASSEVMI